MVSYNPDKLASRSDDSASLIERAAERLERQSQQTGTPADQRGRPAADTETAASEGATSPAEARHPAPPGRPLRREIDLDALAGQGYVTPHNLRTPIAEEVRLVKRSVVNVFQHHSSDRSNLVMVTSSFPREGKSFVALNLAISLACELDYHVLLVDADVERPVIFNRLGLDPGPGLMDWLRAPDRMDVADIIQRTNIDRLSLISAGSPDDRSTELLASRRMQNLTTELANRYPDRLIIFDSPPLLACSEPTTLAEHMGQILFVVEADHTSRSTIERALSLLPPDCWTGLVLNKSRARNKSHYYDDYAYKGYRSGGSHG